MKKALLLFILSFLLVPNITHAQEPEDVRAEVDELKDLLEEIMERIEVLEELLEVDGSTEDEVNDSEENKDESTGLSPALQLEEELNNQDIVIQDVQYIIQDDNLKYLHPDMISVVATNNSEIDIKNIAYSIVAWDINGLPLKIKEQSSFSSGNYVYGGKGENVNITPGQTFGRDYGFAVDSDMDVIHTMKAIVRLYEGFNGEVWENPLYEEFLELYEEKRLADIDNHDEVIYYRR